MSDETVISIITDTNKLMREQLSKLLTCNAKATILNKFLYAIEIVDQCWQSESDQMKHQEAVAKNRGYQQLLKLGVALSGREMISLPKEVFDMELDRRDCRIKELENTIFTLRAIL